MVALHTLGGSETEQDIADEVVAESINFFAGVCVAALADYGGESYATFWVIDRSGVVIQKGSGLDAIPSNVEIEAWLAGASPTSKKEQDSSSCSLRPGLSSDDGRWFLVLAFSLSLLYLTMRSRVRKRY